MVNGKFQNSFGTGTLPSVRNIVSSRMFPFSKMVIFDVLSKCILATEVDKKHEQELTISYQKIYIDRQA